MRTSSPIPPFDPPRSPLQESPGAVASVVRALTILTSFDLDHSEMGVSQVAERVGLHKSTAHRLLSTLESQGFVSKTEGARYMLGRRVFELGAIAYTQGGFHGIVLEELGRLVEQTNETAHLAVLDDVDVLYLEKVESRRTLRMPSAVGRRQPAHRTALGKVLLADLGPGDIERLKNRRLDGATPGTVIDPIELLRELQEVRANGYSVDNEKIEAGLMCIAAPVTTLSGEVCAAVSVSGPAARLRDDVDRTGLLVRECARALSIRLGASLDWLRSYRVQAERTTPSDTAQRTADRSAGGE